jgi:hypothetical protein
VALGYGKVLYDGPSEKLTVEKMKTIYGSGAAEMFDAGQLLPQTSAARQALPGSQSASQPGSEALEGHFFNA